MLVSQTGDKEKRRGMDEVGVVVVVDDIFFFFEEKWVMISKE